jgi:hypothetical protein
MKLPTLLLIALAASSASSILCARHDSQRAAVVAADANVRAVPTADPTPTP